MGPAEDGSQDCSISRYIGIFTERKMQVLSGLGVAYLNPWSARNLIDFFFVFYFILYNIILSYLNNSNNNNNNIAISVMLTLDLD